MNKDKQFPVLMSEDEFKRLGEQAKKEDRSKGWIVRKAVEEYIAMKGK